MSTMKVGLVLSGLSALVAMAGQAAAQQSYPTKPVRIIVATAAGGPTDFMARLAGEALGKSGIQTVIENRGSAGGVLATDSVVNAKPDGYTLLVSHASPIVIFQTLLPKKPPYDALKDLAPVTQLSTVASVATISVKLPVRTLTEFIAYAKARPGELNYSSTGTGNMPHLSAERFKLRTGVDMTHVPYNSAPQALTALMTGEAAFGFQSADVLQQHKAGKIFALATTARRRLPAYPDIPTMDEAGLPGFTSGAWYGLYAPAGTDAAIIQKLHAAIAAGFKDPDVLQRAERSGHDLIASAPQELGAFMRSQEAAWSEVIKATKIKMQ